MGGKNSGVTKKRSRLPRRYRRGVLAKLDQRARESQYANAVLAQITADIGGGDALSFMQRDFAEHYTFLHVIAANDKVLALEGKEIDWQRFIACIQTMIRIADRVGIARVAKSIPRAMDYAASKADESAATANDEPAAP